MKLALKIGSKVFKFENHEDLLKQLESALAEMEQKLTEYKKIKKQKRLISKTIEQLKNPHQRESGNTII